MRYTFGNWELDLHLYELRRDGSPVKLEPQAFNMLAYLLQHRDRVVTRQELLEHLWVGQFIGDSAIERCVMAARKAVGDNGSVQRIIKTLHGRGYRFVASVQEVPPPAAVPPPAVEHAVPQSLLSAQPRAQAAATEILPTESMGHTCTVCQHVNRVQATFCEACGKQLAPTCLDQEPVADAPPSDPFWEPYAAARSLLVPASHAHTFSESAQTPYESLDGERKPVTVLCCALATDTSTTRQTEPDTLYQVTRQFYGYALEEVQRYGGTLQPVGDTELLALFGAPIAYEDHARRAILAALGLHRRLRHGPSRPHTSSVAIGPIRSGIHTGSVMVGYIGATRQLTYTAIGDTTDLARALQHQAEPGTILLSATAKRRVHDIVDVQLVQSKAGFEAATTVYTIRGLATPDTSSTPERASQPRRCVGREYELALLQALWKHAKTGQGQVVGIVGEAGMGKSRLLAEFRQQMQKTQVTYVEGRCVSYGSIVPYLPIRHILWHTCGLNETDNAQTLRTKVIRRLQEVGIDHDEDVLSVFQLLAGSGGPAVAGDVQLEILKDRTFAILRQLRLESCRQRPTIMVVEDLHWIDATSEAYLASLVARLATVPLLLITTYRPGYRPPWLATSYVTQLSLAPLTPSASLQVLRAMLQKTRLPTALTQQIIAQAAGNPFFLEELTRTALDQQDGTPARTVPDTIQTVVLARVDRLPPAAKQLLQAAAVIGIDAPVKLLQSLTELSAEQLHRSLAYLQEAELLHETQCVPNRVYTFKSTVIRDVVYGSLGAMRRQALQARLSAVSTTQGSPRPTQRDLPLVTHTLPHNGAQRVMQP
jgi:DNA-binding winged helix-turn-helix (wHTH) protein/class 3 adenylate cyclase